MEIDRNSRRVTTSLVAVDKDQDDEILGFDLVFVG